MTFNSLVFLLFAPLTILAYFSTRGRLRLYVCLVSSYLFYGWWDWRFLSLIAFSTVTDYFIGLWLDGNRTQRRRKLLLLTSCVLNLGLLGVFKYFNFFAGSLASFLTSAGLNWDFRSLNIILPVGISFYSFQTLSYTIDRYRRDIPAEPDFVRFAVFVAFFPQLVAGPIVRAADFLPQLRRDHPFRWESFASGLGLILWGYFMKVGVADSLASSVDVRFSNPASHTSLSMQLGVFFYAFQIYCDFAGYSSIAIGLARIMGIDFGRNFNRPYFSASFSEFWTRWHISLSSWLRDYLYIPLGGNRKGTAATYRNLTLTMLLGGLWHGASWTFVIWGALHGLYLVAQRLVTPLWRPVSARLPLWASRLVLIPLVFSLTCLGWVFFRAQSFDAALGVISKMLAFDNMTFSAVPHQFQVVKGLFLIAMLLLLEAISLRVKVEEFCTRRPILAAVAGSGLLTAISIFGTFDANAFIYFQF